MALFIAVLIMVAAIPSISGIIEDRKAKRLFNAFNDLTREASAHALEERRPYQIVWDDSGNGVFLRPQEPANRKEAAGIDHVDFGLRLAPDLRLPAALEKNPPRVWTFWPTGTCEPAVVNCKVSDAPWTAAYDPLTEQAAFSSP